jgi:hypothetical protein
MSTIMKTPGVYIEEKSPMPNSIVPLATAVPAFIGYTRNTSYKGEDLRNKAKMVRSFAEFLTIFGSEAPLIQFAIEKATTEVPDFTYGEDDAGYLVKTIGSHYRMHSALQFFYANGGGDCYVISVGDYSVSPNLNDLKAAVDLLEKETAPTLLVIPEAVDLIDPGQPTLKDKYADAYALQTHMINHCGAMRNRMAILDIPRGYWEPLSNPSESVEAFRQNVNPAQASYNSYAAAYYPWLNTSLYQESDITYENLSDSAMKQVDVMLKLDTDKLSADIKGQVLLMISQLTGLASADGAEKPPKENPKLSEEEKLKNKLERRNNAHAYFYQKSKGYKLLLSVIGKKINLTPPAAAMAGIYTSVDNWRGVWKAPANIALSRVISPAISIDHQMQEELNVPLFGKAICAIRTFIGEGNLVWGARTLDGNSQDWRYINVRRTMIFLEQSIHFGIKAYVFEPNNANTWSLLNSLMSNFLTNIWKEGGLMGSSPKEAFSVAVGLGTTITATDILEGILRVSVKVAVTHPEEFLEVTFEQKMANA